MEQLQQIANDARDIANLDTEGPLALHYDLQDSSDFRLHLQRDKLGTTLSLCRKGTQKETIELQIPQTGPAQGIPENLMERTSDPTDTTELNDALGNIQTILTQWKKTSKY